MQLKLYTDYSLRVLLYIGANKHRRVTLSEISDRYGISKEHLRKVVHALGKLELVVTHRGKNGGIELRKRADEINIGELVERAEGRNPILDCSPEACILSSACTLKSVFKRAEEAFFSTLRQWTLEDLLKNRATTSLLAVDPSSP